MAAPYKQTETDDDLTKAEDELCDPEPVGKVARRRTGPDTSRFVFTPLPLPPSRDSTRVCLPLHSFADEPTVTTDATPFFDFKDGVTTMAGEVVVAVSSPIGFFPAPISTEKQRMCLAAFQPLSNHSVASGTSWLNSVFSDGQGVNRTFFDHAVRMPEVRSLVTTLHIAAARLGRAMKVDSPLAMMMNGFTTNYGAPWHEPSVRKPPAMPSIILPRPCGVMSYECRSMDELLDLIVDAVSVIMAAFGFDVSRVGVLACFGRRFHLTITAVSGAPVISWHGVTWNTVSHLSDHEIMTLTRYIPLASDKTTLPVLRRAVRVPDTPLWYCSHTFATSMLRAHGSCVGHVANADRDVRCALINLLVGHILTPAVSEAARVRLDSLVGNFSTHTSTDSRTFMNYVLARW